MLTPRPAVDGPGADEVGVDADLDGASVLGSGNGWHADAAEQALLFSRAALSLRGGNMTQARRFSWQACQGAPTAAEAARTLGGSETQRAVCHSPLAALPTGGVAEGSEAALSNTPVVGQRASRSPLAPGPSRRYSIASSKPATRSRARRRRVGAALHSAIYN